jgi:signal transduction histidine kinase
MRDRRGLLRSNVAGAAAAAFVLIVIGAGSFYFSERTTHLAQESFAVGDADRAIGRILATMLEAESSQRGYLLTSDPSYLAPYEQAVLRAQAETKSLKAILAQAPGSVHLPDIAPLEDVVARKFDELSRTVDLARAGRRAEAIDIVRTGLGLRLGETARAFTTDFRRAADSARRERIDAMRVSANTLEVLTSLGIISVIVLAIVAVMQIRRHTAEIEGARDALGNVNAELERRVNSRTRDLVRANEEIQRYAYIVSHDLRAPLVNIMGFTSELEQASATLAKAVDADRSGPEWVAATEAVERDIPEALSFIKTSMTRMDGLINEILRLSRLGRVTLDAEPIEMNALMDECIAQIQHRLDSAGARTKIDDDLPAIVSDRNSLQQIFSNLLDNAVKYLDPARPGLIRVRGRAARGLATFEVIDNGRGVAPADHERIFDLFRRAGPQDQPGEGIGLAHVRTLVRRLGGDITVVSDGKSGAAFRIAIPEDLRRITSTDET